MNTAVLQRDALLPRPPGGMGRGLILALIAHALLVLALALSVNWHSSEPAGVEAELWSATPQIAAPKAEEPPPTPQPVKPKVVEPPTPVKVAPPPQPTVDAQIAIEQAKREEKKREQLKAQEDEQRRKKDLAAKEAEKLAQKKADADKLAQAQRKQEQDAKLKKQADDKASALAREAYLKRMMGQAGATGAPSATGTAATTSGPSASYAGRVKARIRPNISFPDLLQGNPVVEVTINVAPDGTIMSQRVSKSSGEPTWDDAVMRAIEKTAILPRDEGRAPPSSMTIKWNLRD